MTRKKFIRFAVASIALLSSVSSVQAYTHTLQQGETLEELAHDTFGPPVYGRRGALARLLALNPHIKDFRSVPPGTAIRLDEPELPSSPPTAIAMAPAVPTPAPPQLQPPSTGNLPPPVAQIQQKSSERKPASDGSMKSVETAESSAPQETESGSLELSPLFTFSSLHSVDRGTSAEAILLSDLNSGLRFTWGQFWSEHWSSYLRFGIMHEKFQSDASHTLDGASQNLAQGEIGGWARPWHFLSLGVSAGTFQQLFADAISTTELNLRPIQIPRVAATLRFHIADSDTFHFLSDIQYGYLASARAQGLSVQKGSETRVELRLEERLSAYFSLVGGAFFEQWNQSTDIDTRTFSEMGTTLGVRVQLPTYAPARKTP